VTVGDPGLGTNSGATDFAMAILPMLACTMLSLWIPEQPVVEIT